MRILALILVLASGLLSAPARAQTTAIVKEVLSSGKALRTLEAHRGTIIAINGSLRGLEAGRNLTTTGKIVQSLEETAPRITGCTHPFGLGPTENILESVDEAARKAAQQIAWVGKDNLPAQGKRLAVLDPGSGKLYVGAETDALHLQVAERYGLELKADRYAGGMIEVAEDGTQTFTFNSSTFPVDQAPVPEGFASLEEMIETAGVTVAK